MPLFFPKKGEAASMPGLLQDATQFFFNCNELVLFNQTHRNHIFKVSVWAIARKSASNCVPRRFSLSGFDSLSEREILVSPQQDQVGGLGLWAQLATTLKEFPVAVLANYHKPSDLKTTEIYSFTVLKARISKLKFQQDQNSLSEVM